MHAERDKGEQSPVSGRQLHDRILDIQLKRVEDPAVRGEYARLQELARVLDNVEGKKTFVFDVDGTITMMDYQRVHEMGLLSGAETKAAKIACSVPSCLGLKQAFELVKAHGHKVGIFSAIGDPIAILFHLEQMGVGLENVDCVAVTGAGRENYGDVAALKRAYDIRGKQRGKSIAPTQALVRALYPDETVDLYAFWRDRFGIEFVDVSLYGLSSVYKYSMFQVLAHKQRLAGMARTILDEDLILIGDGPSDSSDIVFDMQRDELRVKAVAKFDVDAKFKIPAETLRRMGHVLSDETAGGRRSIRIEVAPGYLRQPDELATRVDYDFPPLFNGRVAGVRIANYASIDRGGNAAVNSIPKALSVALALSERERDNAVLAGVLQRYAADVREVKSTPDGRVKCVELAALPPTEVSAEYVRQLKLAPKFEEI